MSKKSESDAALIADNRRLATDYQRIAEDGFWYTLGEFREWYGENASTKWVEAINRTREHQAPPPRSWYNAEERPPPPRAATTNIRLPRKSWTAFHERNE